MIKQLITGDEIICQVIEWPDDDISELVIRNAMVVVSIDSPSSGTRYYTFKPWMTMQEGDECLITINGGDIVAQANPTNDLIKYYYNSISKSNLTDEEIDENIEDYINAVKSIVEKTLMDSDELNIIKFPGNNKVH